MVSNSETKILSDDEVRVLLIRTLSILKVIGQIPQASTLDNFESKQMLDKVIRLANDHIDDVKKQGVTFCVSDT